jgi:hypothetical protein
MVSVPLNNICRRIEMSNLIGQRVEAFPSPLLASTKKHIEKERADAAGTSVPGDKYVGWTCAVIAVGGLIYGLYTHSFVWPF